MVEVVQEAHHDLITLNRDLEVQRSLIDSQRHDLASERRRDSLLAPVVSSFGLPLVTALPLVLAIAVDLGQLIQCGLAHDALAPSYPIGREFARSHPFPHPVFCRLCSCASGLRAEDKRRHITCGKRACRVVNVVTPKLFRVLGLWQEVKVVMQS